MITIDNKTLFAAVEARLAEGQSVEMPLCGVSMVPTLRNGDIITLEPAAVVAVGDVVLFRSQGRHLLHRVVAIDGDTFTMQGDNCRTVEMAGRGDILARLVAVRRGKRTLAVDSTEWQRRSCRSLVRKSLKNFVLRWLDRRGRRQLRPWYFTVIAILMWAPVNGLGLPLDNYILSLRADHLLHASVYVPCILFLFDLFPRKQWLAWLAACCIALLTEGGQYLLPYRGFDINDLVANVMGVSLGWLMLHLYKRKQKK